MLNIITIPNEILTTPADEVTFGSEAAIEDNHLLAMAMIETAGANNLFGLAAPQISVSQKIIVVDVNAGKGEKNFVAFFNPKIKPIKTGNDKVDKKASEEFCASVPNIGCVVVRWNKVKITAQDAFGKEFTMDASGMLARIFQHEENHVRGILITAIARQRRIVK